MNEMEAGAESRGREALIWDLRQEIERLKGDVAFVTGMRDSARGAYQKSEAKALEACRQLEAALLQKGEIAEALVRLSTALSDDVKSTGPFKIDMHKVSQSLKGAMMHAVTIIQANGLVEKRLEGP